jgi:hypothetical protein
MLVCESMDACISICIVAMLSIRRSSRPIPSVEFSTTNSLEDEGKLFVHSNPLERLSDSSFSISSVLRMGMSSLSVGIGTSSCAR